MDRIGRSAALYSGLLATCAPLGPAAAFSVTQRFHSCEGAFAASCSSSLRPRGSPVASSTDVLTPLHATSNSGFRSGGAGAGPSPSTVMDSSAVLDPEWETVSELQRRIEEGSQYEHWPEFGSDAARRRRTEAADAKSRREASTRNADPSTRGVFCGFVGTEEERRRMRSADPSDDLTGIDYSI
mmetsp:Transcript_23793/g.70309  ORF Transcript_23793/g.70309 Transcript_23793/m.70309 type:complete len:184 (-) Transcript_23793:141-692(-)